MNQNFVAIAFYEKLTDAIDEVKIQSNAPVKYIHNGRFCIFINGKGYNALGAALIK